MAAMAQRIYQGQVVYDGKGTYCTLLFHCRSVCVTARTGRVSDSEEYSEGAGSTRTWSVDMESIEVLARGT